MMRMEWGRKNYILNKCRGKAVLHVGCVNEGFTADQIADGNFFHRLIEQVASSLAGIDISRDGIKMLRNAGFKNLMEMDICKEVPTGQYDIVIVPEVLEHLSNPGLALDNLAQVDTDEYVFSVPAGDAFRRAEHPDHNFSFSKQSIQTLLQKHGYKITDIRGYHWKRIKPWADGYLITAKWLKHD